MKCAKQVMVLMVGIVGGSAGWARSVVRAGFAQMRTRGIRQVHALCVAKPLRYHPRPLLRMSTYDFNQLIKATVRHGTAALRSLLHQAPEAVLSITDVDCALLKEYVHAKDTRQSVRQINVLDAFEVLSDYGYWQKTHVYSSIVLDLQGDRFCYPLLVGRYGVAVNLRGENGVLPLDVAIRQSNANAVAFLLEHGARSSEDGRVMVRDRIEKLRGEVRGHVPWSPTFVPSRWYEMCDETMRLTDIYALLDDYYKRCGVV